MNKCLNPICKNEVFSPRKFCSRICYGKVSRLLQEHDPEEVYQKYRKYGTLQKVGDFYGVTRERIRQILKKAGYPTKTDQSPRTCLICKKEKVRGKDYYLFCKNCYYLVSQIKKISDLGKIPVVRIKRTLCRICGNPKIYSHDLCQGCISFISYHRNAKRKKSVKMAQIKWYSKNREARKIYMKKYNQSLKTKNG